MRNLSGSTTLQGEIIVREILGDSLLNKQKLYKDQTHGLISNQLVRALREERFDSTSKWGWGCGGVGAIKIPLTEYL